MNQVQLIGGGLANTILAMYLNDSGYKNFVLYERNKSLGGNHTWFYFGSSMDSEDESKFSSISKAKWNSYSVKLKNKELEYQSPCYLLRSEEFHQNAVGNLNEKNIVFDADIRFIKNKLHLGFDPIASSDLIFDGRGVSPWDFKPCGYHKFFAFDVECSEAHGIEKPILFDFNCQQIEGTGFRFLQWFPLDENHLFVKDVRYSPEAFMDDADHRDELMQEINAQLKQLTRVVREESATLPLPMTHQMFHHLEKKSPFPVGIRGGWFHPVTGFSLPTAVNLAKVVCSSIDKTQNGVLTSLEDLNIQWHQQCRFFFFINKILFGAASDEERYTFFERFFSMPEPLIERFFRGDLRKADKMKLMCGKPPVSIGKLIKTMTTKQWLESFS